MSKLVDNSALSAAFSTANNRVRSLINRKVESEIDRLQGDKVYPDYNTLEKIGAELTNMRSFWVFDGMVGSVSESSLTDEFPTDANYSVCLGSQRIIIPGRPATSALVAVLKIQSGSNIEYAREWPTLKDGEIPASSSPLINSQKVLYFCGDSVFKYNGFQYQSILTLGGINSTLQNHEKELYPLELPMNYIANFDGAYPILDEEMLILTGNSFRDLPPDFDVPYQSANDKSGEVWEWFDRVMWAGTGTPVCIEASERKMMFRFVKSEEEGITLFYMYDDPDNMIEMRVKLNEQKQSLDFRFYPLEANATLWFKYMCDKHQISVTDSTDKEDLFLFTSCPYTFYGERMPPEVVEKFMRADRIRLTGAKDGDTTYNVVLRSTQKAYNSKKNGYYALCSLFSEPFYHFGTDEMVFANLNFTLVDADKSPNYKVSLEYYRIDTGSWMNSSVAAISEPDGQETKDETEEI